MDNIPSKAAQVIVTIIPIVGIVMGSIIIFFYLYWHHKQKIMMIEKNLFKKSDFDIDSFSIFSGLILVSTGAVLMIFFLLMEGLSYSLLSGLVPLSIGCSLIIFFIIRINLKKHEKNR